MELVNKLVESTREWLDYIDLYSYTDATEDDVMYGISDDSIRDQLMNLSHYEYLEVVEEVLNQLINDWETI